MSKESGKQEGKSVRGFLCGELFRKFQYPLMKNTPSLEEKLQTKDVQ